MKIITVRAPKENLEKVAALAFNANIEQVHIYEALSVKKNANEKLDVIEIETSTPKAKQFIEGLLVSEFYDPATFSFSVRHPETLFANESPKKEAIPVTRSTTDVYQELLQFSDITVSLVGRVFLSAVLLSFGMLHNHIPLIIAGLLFLPYHHHMLCIALGACLREWKFFTKGLLILFISTVCIVLAGFFAGLSGNHIQFTGFHLPMGLSLIIAATVGAAAGFGAVDDAGRRELIGLAATAHISIYPAWFGLKFALGFNVADKPFEFLLMFIINVFVLILAAAVTFYFMKMNGKGIRRFAAQKRTKAE